MTRTCDWDFRISLDNGRLHNLQTCFQAGPLDENRRDKILERSDRHVRVQSFTALRQQFADISTKAVVLKVSGNPDTRITVQLKSPTNVSLSQTFKQLAATNEMLFTGDFPKESAMLHRLVFHDHYDTAYTVSDTDAGQDTNWYYLRVIQANDQLAWSSPIWINPEKE
jgi:hypothetical protein